MTTMRIIRNPPTLCAECGVALFLEYKPGVYAAEPEKLGPVLYHFHFTDCVHNGKYIRIPAETADIVEVQE